MDSRNYEPQTQPHRWTRSTHRLRRLGSQLFGLTQGLPLFQKELIQQSNRNRTFGIRVILAVILFGTALVYTAKQTNTPLLGTSARLAGHGPHILDGLWGLLLAYIYLYVPASACGAIAGEREKLTLSLLFLTKLGPQQILVEKFLSRVVPMLHVLLLSLPLLSFAHAFGGVNVEMIGVVVWFLFVTTIQVAAVSIACSAYSRKPQQALIMTYLVIFVVSFGPQFADQWITHGRFSTFLSQHFQLERVDARYSAALAANVPKSGVNPTTVGAYLTPTTLSPATFQLAVPAELVVLSTFPLELLRYHLSAAASLGPFSWERLFLSGVPSLLTAFISLVIGQFGVFRELTATRLSELRKLLVRIDSVIWIRGCRQDAARNSNRRNEMDDVPGDNPIAWRESSRNFWGHSRNWIVLLLMLFAPTISIAFFSVINENPSTEVISYMIFALWVISVWLLATHTATLFTAERNQQTLELLLTTPISSEQIVRQKLAGSYRLIWLGAIPIFSFVAFQTWWRSVLASHGATPPRGFSGLEYLVTATACIFVHFRLIAWTSLWMGLRFHSSAKATIAALSFVVGLSVVPIVAIFLPLALFLSVGTFVQFSVTGLLLTQISPAIMIVYIELIDLTRIPHIAYVPVVVHVALYLFATRYIKKQLLENVDMLLGRVRYY